MNVEPRRSAPRVVLIGASNLTRGFAGAVSTACWLLDSPIHVLAALGRGRSYGSRTNFLGRGLPGIIDCDLWQALDDNPGPPTYAFITDIGNDVMYGASPVTIAGWIATVLERLTRHRARIVMTPLPIQNIRTIASWQYRLIGSLLFPGRSLSLTQVLERAEQLDQRVRSLALSFSVQLVDHQPQWYGFDPIHIRRRQIQSAWMTAMAPWVSTHDATDQPHLDHPSKIRLGWIRPARWRWLGRERNTSQPVRCLADGSTVSLF